MFQYYYRDSRTYKYFAFGVINTFIKNIKINLIWYPWPHKYQHYVFHDCVHFDFILILPKYFWPGQLEDCGSLIDLYFISDYPHLFLFAHIYSGGAGDHLAAHNPAANNDL